MKILLLLADDGPGYEIQEFKLRTELLQALPPRWCEEDIHQVIETWLNLARVGDVLDIMTATGGGPGMIMLVENRTVLQHGWKFKLPDHEGQEHDFRCAVHRGLECDCGFGVLRKKRYAAVSLGCDVEQPKCSLCEKNEED